MGSLSLVSRGGGAAQTQWGHSDTVVRSPGHIRSSCAAGRVNRRRQQSQTATGMMVKV